MATRANAGAEASPLKGVIFIFSIMVLAAVPTVPAAVSAADRCQAFGSGTCIFSCEAGDVIGVSAIGASVVGTCGLAAASCDGSFSDCLAAPSTAIVGSIGTCTVESSTPGGYVDCFALPAPTSDSCFATVAYDACSFSCTSDETLFTTATSTAASGFPRVLSRCGGAEADCQSSVSCSTSASVAQDGAGICLSRTVNTIITCSPPPAARCQAFGDTCIFLCPSGGLIGVSAIGSAVAATCGIDGARCDGTSSDCLAEPFVASARSIVGICQTTTPGSGAYVDCFSLARPGSSSCTTSVAYDACAFSCSAGETYVASATSSNSGYPRVLSRCGGAAANCQAFSSCTATGHPTSAGEGICLSRTVSTTISCAPPVPTGPARCQAFSGSCAFLCAAGSVIVTSAIGASVQATCGSSIASCAGTSSDCLAEPFIAGTTVTGECRMTQGTGGYVDCFSIAAPASSSCTTSIAYDACSYSCSSGDTLHAHASTSSGYPRVLSDCGGGVANCQSFLSCDATGSALRSGAGVCLSRTERTTISCSG